jgi:LysR family transcriptional regulator of beta-lactamase
VAAQGLDLAIRFGDGTWPGTQCAPLLDAPLGVLCSPEVAKRLSAPRDLIGETLLRSYRVDEWALWFAAAGVQMHAIHGPMFDSSRLMAEAAMQGAGVALAPVRMFESELQSGRLVRAFDIEVDTGSYWLTWSKTKRMTSAMHSFMNWIFAEAGAEFDAARAASSAGIERRY